MSSERLISKGLWREIKAIPRNGKSIRAAIAYYSKDHLKLTKGDQLLVNASLDALTSGATNASVLLQLSNRGVAIHNVESLHAKVILIDKTVVVGSANSSRRSEQELTEAAVLSTSWRMRSAVSAFIELGASENPALSHDELTRMSKIEVSRREPESPVKRTSIDLGASKVWWLSTSPMSERLREREKVHEDRGMSEAHELSEEKGYPWDVLRYSERSILGRKLKLGDTVVQAFSTPFGNQASTEVYCPANIAHVTRGKGWVRFYLQSLLSEWGPKKYDRVQVAVEKQGGKLPTVRSSKVLADGDFEQIRSYFDKKSEARERRRARVGGRPSRTIRC